MKINRQFLTQKGLALLLCLALPTSVMALSTDRDQPAEIEADDVELDFAKGTRTFTNNVLVIQGTLRIQADKVHAVYDGENLKSATAWGSLARFKQRPDGKPNDVEGWGKKIIVDQKANTLTLVGQAALKQGADTARGDTIIYNMANDTLKLKGGAKIGATDSQGKGVSKTTRDDPFGDKQAKIDRQEKAEKDRATKVKRAAKREAKDLGQEAPTKEELDALVEADKEKNPIKEEEVEQAAPENRPEPVKAGRSRLIIQPKKTSPDE